MKIITISGNSTSGKSTLEKMLIESHSSIFQKVVSHTTRPPRKTEAHGEDYYFISKKEITDIDFIEHDIYNENFYGTSSIEINNIISCGKIPVVVLTPDGVKELKQNLTDLEIFSFFLKVKSDTLKTRMKVRLNKNITLAESAKEVKSIKIESNNRMKSIQKDEQYWEDKVSWTKIYNEFSERTENNVIESILNYIK